MSKCLDRVAATDEIASGAVGSLVAPFLRTRGTAGADAVVFETAGTVCVVALEDARTAAGGATTTKQPIGAVLRAYHAFAGMVALFYMKSILFTVRSR